MRLEWDDDKAKVNLAKHGVSFELAAQVFDDPGAVVALDRYVDGEERWRTIGRVGLILVLFVAHTYTDEAGETAVRIISARKASRQEVKAYERGDEGSFR